MKAVFIERHGGPEELKFGDLPDPVALEEAANEGCTAEYEPYFGAPLDPTATQVTWLTPSAETWEQGDQEVVCIAVDLAALAESSDTSAPA